MTIRADGLALCILTCAFSLTHNYKTAVPEITTTQTRGIEKKYTNQNPLHWSMTPSNIRTNSLLMLTSCLVSCVYNTR